MVVGFAASNTNVWQAFGTVALGWLRFCDAANYWTATFWSLVVSGWQV